MRVLLVLLLLVLACRYRGLQDIFIYPIQEGRVWFYEEPVGEGVVDSIVVLKDTTYTYKGVEVAAWRVRKSHESSTAGLIIDTNTVFIYNDTIKELLPTEGLFPDSVQSPYGWVKFQYYDDFILVNWLPLRVKPGDRWIMATGRGKIIISGDENELELSIEAQATGYEDVSYTPLNPRFSSTELVYENALKVEYTVNVNLGNLNINTTLLTIWWKSGIGPVKNDSYGYPENLVTYLVHWE